MLTACWSVKGGSGVTVVAAGLALAAAAGPGPRFEGAGGAGPAGALLVDLCGDVPAALGCTEPRGPGVAEWLAAGDGVPPDGWARLEVDTGTGVALVPRGAGPLGPAARVEDLAGLLADDRRPVVVDCGLVELGARGDAEARLAMAAAAMRSVLVTRGCYLALRRATDAPLRPSGVVFVREPGRALGAADIADILGVPVLAEVPCDPAVARAVDAGLLGTRLPRTLERGLRRAA
jgi:hypothetical protein